MAVTHELKPPLMKSSIIIKGDRSKIFSFSQIFDSDPCNNSIAQIDDQKNDNNGELNPKKIISPLLYPQIPFGCNESPIEKPTKRNYSAHNSLEISPLKTLGPKKMIFSDDSIKILLINQDESLKNNSIFYGTFQNFT